MTESLTLMVLQKRHSILIKSRQWILLFFVSLIYLDCFERGLNVDGPPFINTSIDFGNCFTIVITHFHIFLLIIIFEGILKSLNPFNEKSPSLAFKVNWYTYTSFCLIVSSVHDRKSNHRELKLDGAKGDFAEGRKLVILLHNFGAP